MGEEDARGAPDSYIDHFVHSDHLGRLAHGHWDNRLAEGVGFEPTMPCGIPVFKTGAFDRSATPPGQPEDRKICGV